MKKIALLIASLSLLVACQSKPYTDTASKDPETESKDPETESIDPMTDGSEDPSVDPAAVKDYYNNGLVLAYQHTQSFYSSGNAETYNYNYSFEYDEQGRVIKEVSTADDPYSAFTEYGDRYSKTTVKREDGSIVRVVERRYEDDQMKMLIEEKYTSPSGTYSRTVQEYTDGRVSMITKYSYNPVISEEEKITSSTSITTSITGDKETTVIEHNAIYNDGGIIVYESDSAPVIYKWKDEEMTIPLSYQSESRKTEYVYNNEDLPASILNYLITDEEETLTSLQMYSYSGNKRTIYVASSMLSESGKRYLSSESTSVETFAGSINYEYLQEFSSPFTPQPAPDYSTATITSSIDGLDAEIVTLNFVSIEWGDIDFICKVTNNTGKNIGLFSTRIDDSDPCSDPFTSSFKCGINAFDNLGNEYVVKGVNASVPIPAGESILLRYYIPGVPYETNSLTITLDAILDYYTNPKEVEFKFSNVIPYRM